MLHVRKRTKSKNVLKMIYGFICVIVFLMMYAWYNLPTLGFKLEHKNVDFNRDITASHEQSLTLKDKNFVFKGKSIPLISGAVHYFRFPREYWRDRLIKMKMCGLNTIETYVPWNLHEPTPGKFIFNGDLDLVAFLKLAHELELLVLIRPGPYICSEWEFGGLPSWLLRDPAMRVRTMYYPYITAVKSYFNKLLPMLQSLQYGNGGPIVAVQLDNEYGSYFKDQNYLPWLKQLMKEHGIYELLFVSDNIDGTKMQTIPSVLKTINFKQRVKEHFSALEEIQPNGPLMVMEFWTGWFDWWGAEHHSLSLEEFGETLDAILSVGASVNFYMFYGGTNFGFMNGGFIEGKNYKSDITSYDYDALISENGDLTPKYYKAKIVIAKHYPDMLSNTQMFSVIEKMPRTAYKSIDVTHYISIWNAVSITEKFQLDIPVAMEMLDINNEAGQSYGYTLYTSTIDVSAEKLLLIEGLEHVHDRGILFTDHSKVLIIDNKSKQKPFQIKADAEATKIQINVLVENGGRVNWLILDDQRKGLTKPLIANGFAIKDWIIHPFEMKPEFIRDLRHSENWLDLQAATNANEYPSFFKATLRIQSIPQDTYIDMTEWGKGVVFVNGRNLGRYWSIGPQKALYLPAPWLNSGSNEIIVFEEQLAAKRLHFIDEPKLG